MSWKTRIDQWTKNRIVRSLTCDSNSRRSLPRSARTVKNIERQSSKLVRHSTVETLENRTLFNVDPIWVGGVYVEEDQGGDSHGDSFYVTFRGGANGTQLTRLVIDTDQGAPGYSSGDNIFDTVESSSSLGADHAFPYKLESITAVSPNARVIVEVSDGGTQLVLNFENFVAGDKVKFSIDVDEIQRYRGNSDPAAMNPDLDPITSGVEFADSKIRASFTAPRFENASAQGTFVNAYDSVFASTGLDLPSDNAAGLRDRTAGAAATVVQVPKPIELAGAVYVDNNLSLTQDADEMGIGGVQLTLFRLENGNYVNTGVKTTTDSQGRYQFGVDLGLAPGTYQIRESQPANYLSVGAAPGRLDGQPTLGTTVASDKDVLTDIQMLQGDSRGTQLDFAEAQPVQLCGFVYRDNNDNGTRENGEAGIGGVEIQIVSMETIAGPISQSVLTQPDGSYCFVGLPPGRYWIGEVAQPAGFFDGRESSGTVGGQTRGTAIVNDQITEIQLNGNENGIEFNFGEIEPSSLSGHVCLAMPGFDCFSNEPGACSELPGVKIELLNAAGAVVATTFTAADGTYKFDNLPAGVYKIIEAQPTGLLEGGSKAGRINGLISGNAISGSRIEQITLAGGQHGVDYEFCELPPASLSGNVYRDDNNDGIRQVAEPMLEGVTIRLFDLTGSKIAETTTDLQGRYQFGMLRQGTYRIDETTPNGFLDGKDSVGMIAGQIVGQLDGTDSIGEIELPTGMVGEDYNFGEQLVASLQGQVFADLNEDCIFDPDESPLAGVRIELLNAAGQVIKTTLTDADGNYRFADLTPGVYSVRELQPTGYFQGGQRAPDGIGDTSNIDLIADVLLSSGKNIDQLDFCEVPPATIAGYVFQDGAPIITDDGQPPLILNGIRDGIRTPDDAPIGGVMLELRSRTGERLKSSDALPGTYSGETIRVVTDSNGYYEFQGLRPGVYHVYQTQPAGFFDGRDTPGSAGGFAINVDDTVIDFEQQKIIELLSLDASTNPGHDAILMINLQASNRSVENNFSEVVVTKAPTVNPPAPPPPVAPPPYIPTPVNGFVSPPFERVLVTPPSVLGRKDEPEYGLPVEYTWHLSVINAGEPRGHRVDKEVSRQRVASETKILNASQWTIDTINRGRWVIVSTSKNKPRKMSRDAFDILGARQMAGDFNGDGRDELALFKDGEWLLDINGNGIWDRGDLWAKLGDRGDIPVIGDWDNDGKDDIGIYGPAWDGDDKALANEPGLPDPENRNVSTPKNLPPRSEKPGRDRLMQRSITGEPRSDEIDHVFRFGTDADQPIAGDFNGDGVSTLGVFNNGKWRIDVNGDGRFSEEDDSFFDFGEPGDIAVSGDFNGDGLDEIAVVRGRDLIIDSNGNGTWDATDRVFEIEGEVGQVVVGDFDGDGVDEAAFYATLPTKIEPEARTAER
ncbi:MAG: SdrD B-like domain-containing protein [Pirellula sp.]